MLHLTLGGVLDLALQISLGAFGLELGQVSFQLLGALLEVDVAAVLDLLLLSGDFCFEGGEVVVSGFFIDAGDDVGSEVDDLFQILGCQVKQVTQTGGHTLEVPDVGDGGGELNVAHALTTYLGTGDFHAASFTDDALEADALVLTTGAFPVPGRTEDTLAEEAVLLWLQRTVVDGLRLFDLTVGPATNVVGASEADSERIEEVDVAHVTSFPQWDCGYPGG